MAVGGETVEKTAVRPATVGSGSGAIESISSAALVSTSHHFAVVVSQNCNKNRVQDPKNDKENHLRNDLPPSNFRS